MAVDDVEVGVEVGALFLSLIVALVECIYVYNYICINDHVFMYR